MEDILGMFGSIGETEDISEIINQFAAFLEKIIKIITNFLNGNFSFETEEDTSATA